MGTLLGTPFSQPRPVSVGSPNSPEEDLAQILTTLGTETDVTVANALRQRAIDILEGNPVADAAYSGIGLLNDNARPRGPQGQDGSGQRHGGRQDRPVRRA